jgi:hypothetical protein
VTIHNSFFSYSIKQVVLLEVEHYLVPVLLQVE